MIEAYGDIWDHAEEYDAIVITTNGFVKKNGEAVMGKGIALEAKNRYPWLARNLGTNLNMFGNRVYRFDVIPNFVREKKYDFSLFTLPVKPTYGPNGEPGWRAKADLQLINLSVHALVQAIDNNYSYREDYKVLMPRPGCGNGGLKWDDVRPVLEPILDDRFTVMERL
jgi:hypothetical protein